MLHLTSWMTTLPIMVIGMVSIVLVIGVIVLAVMYSSPCFIDQPTPFR